MVVVGVGGIEGEGEGGQGHGKDPPPRIFSKVASIYAPLVLPIILHDFLQNYMKKLPKFVGEGDLIVTKHIAFFYQFVDILGIENKDFYSRMLVQAFEVQLRARF